MICEKCGKGNVNDIFECVYCGAKMPKLSGGGGFADILNYTNLGDVISRPIKGDTNDNKKETLKE